MKIGIQLFGILRSAEDDPLSILRILRETGYRRLEVCLSPEPIPGFDHVVWPLEWFKAHAEEIRGLGFEVVSCHIFSQNPAACAGDFKRLAEEYGIRHFVVKSPKEYTETAFQQAALNYMRLADVLAEAGAEVLVHNGYADLSARLGGRTAFEYLLDSCLGKVGAQVDIGWALAGGEDPEALLWRNAGRVKSLHFKDLVPEDGKYAEVPIGAGTVDILACFQFARAFGCPLIADMDSFAHGWQEDAAASFATLSRLGQFRADSVSFLNELDTETGEVRVLKAFDKVIEAPNWLKKTNRILYNSEGHIYAYDLDSGTETRIDSGECDNCNNDHVVSPDETQIAVSHSARGAGFSSRVYALPLEGGAPRLVTPNSPSFLHGWSPDGGEFAYCAFRQHEGKLEVDVYAIPAEGGEEICLTQGGFNDGPEYAPDGEHIWFNSTRTGLMQIWRMRRDGSEQTQMTFNARNNWFGHVSPDGRKVAYLSYREGDLEAHEHLPNMQVELWLMDADGGNPHKIAALFGGQGSINVNSWAGDSRHLAFVSYALKHK